MRMTHPSMVEYMMLWRLLSGRMASALIVFKRARATRPYVRYRVVIRRANCRGAWHAPLSISRGRVRRAPTFDIVSSSVGAIRRGDLSGRIVGADGIRPYRFQEGACDAPLQSTNFYIPIFNHIPMILQADVPIADGCETGLTPELART